MQLIQRYIGQHIVPSILLVLFVLVGLDILFTFLYELKFVGRGEYTLGILVEFIVLTLPRRLYFVFPWASLLGSLLALGKLAAHNELIVLRTSGLSIFDIGKIVFKASLLLILGLVLLGEGIAPFTEQVAQDKKTFALSKGGAVHTVYGIWVKSGNEFIHVRKVDSNQKLSGVTCYQFGKNQRLENISQAETATWSKEGWVLHNVRGTSFLEDKVVPLQKESTVYKQLPDPEVLQTSMAKHLERLSLNNLWKSIQHHKQNDSDARTYKLTFWTKIFQPFSIIVMVFLAIPFVFGPLRSVTVGFRMVAGISMGFLFYLLNNFLPLIAVYKSPPIVAAFLPLLVFTGVGYIMLQRVR